MILVDAYYVSKAKNLLYDLLAERTPEQSISHKKMPTRKEHMAFFNSRPYEAWYMILVQDAYVGAIYLSKQREIGISIFKKYRGNGYGKQAVKCIMSIHPGKFLANINPANSPSIEMFKKMGFKRIQETYFLE